MKMHNLIANSRQSIVHNHLIHAYFNKFEMVSQINMNYCSLLYM